jgi:hypothetical protein
MGFPATGVFDEDTAQKTGGAGPLAGIDGRHRGGQVWTLTLAPTSQGDTLTARRLGKSGYIFAAACDARGDLHGETGQAAIGPGQ